MNLAIIRYYIIPVNTLSFMEERDLPYDFLKVREKYDKHP
jgi:hypothetical protein